MYQVSNYGNDPNHSNVVSTNTTSNKTIVFIQRRMQYRLRQVMIQYQATCDRLRQIEIAYAKNKMHMQHYLFNAELLNTINVDQRHYPATVLIHQLNQIERVPKILSFALKHPILNSPPQHKQFIEDIHSYIEHYKLPYDYHNGTICHRNYKTLPYPTSLYIAGYNAEFIPCFESALIRFRMFTKKMQCYYDELIELQDKIIVYRTASVQRNSYCRTQEHYKLCCSLYNSLLLHGPIRHLQHGYQIIRLLDQCYVN